MFDLVGNPEDRFSHDVAHINTCIGCTSTSIKQHLSSASTQVVPKDGFTDHIFLNFYSDPNLMEIFCAPEFKVFFNKKYANKSVLCG